MLKVYCIGVANDITKDRHVVIVLKMHVLIIGSGGKNESLTSVIFYPFRRIE
jgi:hypothetical protein